MDENTHPRIELVATSSLMPNPRNARTHSDKQLDQIGASIDQFGWLVPIVIGEDGMIAAGHGRWMAARKRGLAEVPVIRARFVTDVDRRAFALAENRIADLSGWDEDLLADELQVLFEDGYELEITGFSLADLDFSVPEPEARPDEPVELPREGAPTVSRVGDLWQIGEHRLYCGDAREVGSWEALLGDERADLVFADPPYNVPINGFVSGNGYNRHREFVAGSGELTPPEFTAFLRAIFRNCVRFAATGSIHYHCMDWRHMRELLDAADGVYDRFKQLVVWKRTTAVRAPSTAASTSWCSCSRRARRSTSTTLVWAKPDVIAPMSSSMQAATPSARDAMPTLRRIRRSSLPRWSPTSSSTVRTAATSWSILASAQARP